MFTQVFDVLCEQRLNHLAHYLQRNASTPINPPNSLHLKRASKVDNEFGENLNKSQMEVTDVNKI